MGTLKNLTIDPSPADRKKLSLIRDYPLWICHECGEKYGKRECGIATFHTDTCGVCGERKTVTEPRDYGHLKDGWQYAAYL